MVCHGSLYALFKGNPGSLHVTAPASFSLAIGPEPVPPRNAVARLSSPRP